MNNFVSRLAGAATLGVAVLPWIALSVAHAQPASVKISDLNLSQPAQVETLNARVDQAASRVCADYVAQRDLDRTAACRSAVRAEAMDKLADAQRAAQMAKAHTVTLASR